MRHSAQDVPEQTDDSEQVYEVQKVIGHRVNLDGKFSFNIRWKGYGKPTFVDDIDCNCDVEIAEYLKNKNIHTAFLFCRVSTKEQANSMHVSLDAQKAELLNSVHAYEQAHNVHFQRIKVYQISGSAYTKIPEQLKMIGEACLPKDAIFVWRVDRLSRNIKLSLSWLMNLDERDVILYSHHEQISYREHELQFIKAVLQAHEEAHILGERVKLAIRQRRARGDHIGRAPYGKKIDTVLDEYGNIVRKVLVNEPYEMSVLDLVKRYKSSKQARDGRNVIDLVQTGFAERNIRNRKGQAFSRAQIARMVKAV
jgi:DNA invertase Pin-like site-specific DNA recombinase